MCLVAKSIFIFTSCNSPTNSHFSFSHFLNYLFSLSSIFFIEWSSKFLELDLSFCSYIQTNGSFSGQCSVTLFWKASGDTRKDSNIASLIYSFQPFLKPILLIYHFCEWRIHEHWYDCHSIQSYYCSSNLLDISHWETLSRGSSGHSTNIHRISLISLRQKR